MRHVCGCNGAHGHAKALQVIERFRVCLAGFAHWSVEKHSTIAHLAAFPPLTRILIFGDLLHPRGVFAFKTLLDSDVRHALGRRSTVPMFHIGWDPDDIAGFDVLNRLAPPADASLSCGHDERLTQWMEVPCRAGAWLERDSCTCHARRLIACELCIDAHSALEEVG